MRRGFIEAQQDVFGAYIDLLGQRGEAAEALVVAERARARAFLDLRAERTGDTRLSTPASIADAQRAAARLQSTIVAYWVGPSARLDLGGAAGSRAGAGPRAGPAVASDRAGAGDGGARRLRERGPAAC